MPTDVFEPVVGDPVGVSATGRTLDSIALDVARLASRLRALASGNDEWSGTAARSAQARTTTVPPKLDKAHASYAAAGSALSSYSRSLADAQQQSAAAIAAAGRAYADLDAARAAQAAAASRDAATAASARAAGVPVPPATAPRYEASIDDASARLARARALNDQAHEQQSQAARVAAAALQQASRVGIHNASWLHHITHAVGHWASTRWASALRDVAKVANVVSALAGLGALVLAVAGVFFPPLEAAAAVLETVSLVSAVVAGAADTALAVTGRASWSAVGVDALTLAPAGLGKVVTRAAPLIRESRLITPTAVVHASEGDAQAASVRRLSNATYSQGSGEIESWANPATLPIHFGDHGADFGAVSPEEYVHMASSFLRNSQRLHLPTKVSPDGTIRVFDRDSNTFGSYDLHGRTKTFFKPTSPTYWTRQKGTPIEDLMTP